MKKNLFVFYFLTLLFTACAQPAIQWQKCLGGTAGDFCRAIRQTSDGGYIVTGYSASNDGDITGNQGNDDYWVVKLNSSGNMQWQKSLGGSGFDDASHVQQTSDGGYVIAGYSNSNNGDVTGNQGNDDYWIVKLNGSGSILWQKSFGGTLSDDAFFIQETSDGGFIIAGDTQSNDGDVSGSNGGYDAWIIKISSNGTLQWQKCLGGTSDDTAAGVQQTIDGGYIIVGSTLSNNGDVSGNHGNWDYWLVKLNNLGSIQWQKCLGGTGEDIGYAIQQTLDTGYVITGFTKSNNGDVGGMHGTSGIPDYWVVKVSNLGTIQWQKCFGGTGDDKAYSIQQTADSGYVVGGYTKSNDGDVSGQHSVGFHDYWLLKLSNAGNIQWQKCLGGGTVDWARSVQQTADGAYVAAGWSLSSDGDVSNNNGNYDYWVVKLGLSTGLEENSEVKWRIFPNPSSGIFSFAGHEKIRDPVMKVYNSQGQNIFESRAGEDCSQLDLSGQLPGIYFALISGENFEWTGKLVVEKAQ